MNEPVLGAGAIAGLITAGISFARLMGWLALDDEQFAQLMIFVGLALPIVGAAIARQRVTPLANPTDQTGTELVRRDGLPVVE